MRGIDAHKQSQHVSVRLQLLSITGSGSGRVPSTFGAPTTHVSAAGLEQSTRMMLTLVVSGSGGGRRCWMRGGGAVPGAEKQPEVVFFVCLFVFAKTRRLRIWAECNPSQHSSSAVLTAPTAWVNGTAHRPSVRNMERFVLLVLGCLGVSRVTAGKFSFYEPRGGWTWAPFMTRVRTA